MGKRALIILGNGFSIDFVSHCKWTGVDLTNLFYYGAHVPWPANGERGFLSYKHCPFLWHLGARPYITASEGMALIEDIITALNVHALKWQKNEDKKKIYSQRPDSFYLNAYRELVIYLKHLFVYYNSKVDIPGTCIYNNWSWKKIFDKFATADYEEVNIVTYNYDIFLERLFVQWGYDFGVWLGKDENVVNHKFCILKPHGSIGFAHKEVMDEDAFEINYEKDIFEGKIHDFSLEYDDLHRNFACNALIPPAGEAGRYDMNWATSIRKKAEQVAKQISEKDTVLICGLSYWHVDRAEIDTLLTSINPQANVKVINPDPNRAFNAVITSIFPNYIMHRNGNDLE